MLAAHSLIPQWLPISVLLLATSAMANDHWDALLNRHTCNGHCASRHHQHATTHSTEQRHSHELPTELSYSSSDDSYLVASEPMVSELVDSGSGEQDDNSHLFLSIQSQHGDHGASGLTRAVKLEYSPVLFEMHSTNPMMPSEFRLLIDGIAAHPEQSRQTSQWQQSEQSWSRTVEWSCPPLGRHSVQFQIRLNNRLIASEPLWIEIVAPAKPEAIAVGSSLLGTRPMKSGEVVSVYRDTMVVRFAMSPATQMLMHVDGFEDFKATLVDDCSFEFNLKELSVGRHAIRFSRVVGEDCAMTSEPSDTLWIQYEPLHALNSLRNENAERRKAIVDHIRSVSTQAVSRIPDATFLSRGTFDFHEPRYADQVPASAKDATNQATGSETSPSKNDAEPVPAIEVPNPAHLPALNAPALNTESMNRKKEETSIVLHSKPTRTVDSAVNRFVAHSGQQETTQAAQTTPPAAAPATPTPDPLPNLHSDTSASAPGKPQTEKQDQAIAPPLNSETFHIAAQSNAESHHKPTPHPLSSEAFRLSAENTARALGMLEDNLASAESAFQANKVVSHVIFDAPAYFTQNGYGPSGQEDARNGLVLLEGMELSTQASGHWELKIPYIKSMTPAVLHLQIQFKTDKGEWKPITIQPVCFKAGKPCIDDADSLCESSAAANSSGSKQSAKSDCSDSLQPKVVITGYSPILRREVGYFTEVRRRGSVVFGHGYSALEDRSNF